MVEFWCSYPNNKQTFIEHLKKATDWGHTHSVSVAMTEFGANAPLNAAARNAYFIAMRSAADKLNLPWGVWALDDQMGFDRPVSAHTVSFRLPPDLLADLGLAH
jgi:hypothetical protein